MGKNIDRYKEIKSELIFGKYSEEIPKISIVIPTYNRDHLLKEALMSALNQDTSEIYEIIVVEDSPEEDSKIERLIKEINNPKIILYKNKKNLGLFGNWNRCLELARTEWICMLHDDDILFPNYISTIYKTINENKNADFIFYKPLVIDLRNQSVADINIESKEDIEVKKVLSQFFMRGDELTGIVGICFKKSIAIKIDGFKEEMYPSSDWEFFYRYSKEGNIYKYENFPIALYRFGENESLKPQTIEGFIYKDFEIKNYIMKDLNFRYKNMIKGYLKIMTLKHVDTLERKHPGVLDKKQIIKDLNLDYNFFNKLNYRVYKTYLAVLEAKNKWKIHLR